MLLIFVDEVTDRLIFTLDFIFASRKIEYRFTNDPVFFDKTSTNKFNYSNRFFENAKGLLPATVLFDEAVFPYSIEKSNFGAEECMSFDRVTDPLASIFYVLSRMEEYTNQRKDDHERFSAKESLQYKFGWLEKVMCDRWAEAFISHVETELSIYLNPAPIPVRLIPTFDIDNTYAFKWKTGWRRLLGTGRDWLRRDHERLKRRKQVVEKSAEDPYDTFEYILSIAASGFDVKLFWLLGDYGKYDKNISSMDIRHRQLIQKMAKSVSVGLHPSYKSNAGIYHLEAEKQRIDSILGEPVLHSRQHFLKLQLPVTYKNLISKGFTDDFTLGYADETGFRAGTARPFNFFDLEKNVKTDYILHPFAYMDGTLNEYKHWTIEESKAQVLKLYKEVSRFGGDFIFIWHNETIGDFGKWKGWREVLEFTLNLRDEY